MLIIYRPIISNNTKKRNDEYQETHQILFAPNSKAHRYIIMLIHTK